MKIRPIIFSTPMVQALLAGRKTMTRRTKGLENIDFKASEIIESNSWPRQGNFIARFAQDNRAEPAQEIWQVTDIIKSPYNVGDILWVREKFRNTIDCQTGKFHSWHYYADMPEDFHKKHPFRYKPSIHMPKEACRLFLKVKSIRVERLQQITDQDAVAEGIEPISDSEFSNVKKWGWRFKNYLRGDSAALPIASFMTLWESINGEGSWNTNPWVWVIEFEKCAKPESFLPC